MKKRYKLSLLLLILFVIVIVYGSKHVFPYAIIKPYKVVTTIQPSTYNLNATKANIYTNDHITLKGLFIQTPLKQKAIVILIHGIGSCKEHLFPLAKRLSSKGYSSYLFDSRAHGDSGGDYCTYGFYEKQDITAIVSQLKKQHPKSKIGIWGHSLGGAIAIQSLAIDKRIEFGIIESTFTDVSQVVYDYKKRILKGIGIRWLSNYILANAGEIANFNPNKVKPLNDVKNIGQPILFAHGDADERISINYGKELYNNCIAKDKEFITVPDAGHNSLHAIGGDNYYNKVFHFLSEHCLKNK